MPLKTMRWPTLIEAMLAIIAVTLVLAHQDRPGGVQLVATTHWLAGVMTIGFVAYGFVRVSAVALKFFAPLTYQRIMSAPPVWRIIAAWIYLAIVSAMCVLQLYIDGQFAGAF